MIPERGFMTETGLHKEYFFPKHWQGMAQSVSVSCAFIPYTQEAEQEDLLDLAWEMQRDSISKVNKFFKNEKLWLIYLRLLILHLLCYISKANIVIPWDKMFSSYNPAIPTSVSFLQWKNSIIVIIMLNIIAKMGNIFGKWVHNYFSPLI